MNPQRGSLAGRSIVSALIAAALLSVAVHAERSSGPAAGRAIYTTGSAHHGRPLGATMGGAEIPASLVPCVNCHGGDGRGLPEGGVVPSDIRWAELTKPYVTETSAGRRRPPYTAQTLGRAITAGVDSAGQTLNSAMPRYRMSESDLADLIEYLKVIGQADAEGVTDDSIRLATVVPAGGPGAAMGRQMAAVLAGVFADAGEIHGRRLRLDVVEVPGEDPEAVRSQLENVLNTRPPFAFVGGMISGIERPVEELVDRAGVPLILPANAGAETSPSNRQRFDLFPPLEQQLSGLFRFALAESEPTPRRVVIVARGETIGRAEQALESLDSPPPAEVIDSSANDVHERISATIEEGSAIVFLDPQLRIAAVADRVEPGTKALLLFAGGLLPRDFFEAPALTRCRVLVTLVSTPADLTARGLAEYRSFAARHGIEDSHLAAQISAYTAATVVVHTLKQSGRAVTRDRLRQALEGLYQFETGVSPPLTFGRSGRVGARRVHVATLDRSTGLLARVAEFTAGR